MCWSNGADPNAGVGTTCAAGNPNDDRRFQCLWKSNAPTDAGNAGRVELMEKNQFDSTDYAGNAHVPSNALRNVPSTDYQF